MCVLAHPDDESLGTGALLAKCKAEGISTYLVCATRGERGWFADPNDYPGQQALGRVREAELAAAARVLGVREVSYLDYLDGDLDQTDPAEAIARIAGHLRRVRPQVVVTFAPDGAYGHPDHIAISQFTGAAIVCAADPAFETNEPAAAHRVSKFYYFVDDGSLAQSFPEVYGNISIEVDGVIRRAAPWEDWAVTTRIDASDQVETVLQAIFCHVTQIAGYEPLKTISAGEAQRLLGEQTLVRVFSSVNGGRQVETDVFQGLR
jgi:LmbE family N-acetylglucosaminyl deacetylase